ncbi:MAG: type II toxin-antitoxin system PemK/MazF family toxin [bacterium]|nr:type II toxin-antitoxin system PemK/MazF family toxin [bacterium]
MVIARGDIWWAALPDPVGSGPGFHRPVVVVKGDTFNRSRIATVVVVPLTSNTRLAAMPGNVLLSTRKTGLPKDSVANLSQVIAIDRSLLPERIGRIAQSQLELIWRGIDILFDRVPG